MKFKITMKDPNGVDGSINEAVLQSLSSVEAPFHPDEDEYKILKKARTENLNEAIRKWIEYGELITLEIDTDADTITVCEVR